MKHVRQHPALTTRAGERRRSAIIMPRTTFFTSPASNAHMARAKRVRGFSVTGSKRPASCEQHAEHGKVNVQIKHCSHGDCTISPSFNFDGGGSAVFCSLHAEEGMINIRTRCARDACTKLPAFYFEGKETDAWYATCRVWHGERSTEALLTCILHEAPAL